MAGTGNSRVVVCGFTYDPDSFDLDYLGQAQCTDFGGWDAIVKWRNLFT